ncbi:tail fiber protein [Nostoc ellipsosporum NOK]|jgi:microcystin-dependent protein|nr:tail fiber protein [Nostoc ellipsosporum NOK]
MEGYIAEIRMFAPNFAPRLWALCNGQILQINTNQALFSLLGTTFGGNGVQTFALPDFRGRTGVGVGTGSNGANSYTLGMQNGTTATTLTTANIPPHTHGNLTGTVTMGGNGTPGNAESPANAYFGNDGSTKYDASNDNVTMAPAVVSLAAGPGSVQPVNNMVPYLAINYIICLQGIFPSRN